jgi:hypothetical protein
MQKYAHSTNGALPIRSSRAHRQRRGALGMCSHSNSAFEVKNKEMRPLPKLQSYGQTSNSHKGESSLYAGKQAKPNRHSSHRDSAPVPMPLFQIAKNDPNDSTPRHD